MKVVWGSLLTMLFLTGPGQIAKINSLKSEAKEAFQAGDFKTAIQKYRYLIDSMGVKEDEVMMNLSSAYFRLKDTANAFTSYQSLTQSANAKIKSLANQQLGVLATRQGKSDDALNYFKQALKAASGNEDARFNYEMVKKKLERQKKKDQKDDKKNNDKDKGKPEEPSEFAKQLKAKADELVRQRLYRDAYQLMTDGLKKDKTVAAYQEFIKRTKDVIEIAK